MIVTEQNPTSLGPTVPEFDISTAKGPFPKTQFSMCTPEVSPTLALKKLQDSWEYSVRINNLTI